MPDNLPIRKTTRMAVNAHMNQHRRALEEIAQAALEDGEAPEGYILDLDQNVWRKPDISPTKPVSAPEAEAVPSSS